MARVHRSTRVPLLEFLGGGEPCNHSSRASQFARIIARILVGGGGHGIVVRVYRSSRATLLACVIARIRGGGDHAIIARVYHSSRASLLAYYEREDPAIIARVFHSLRAS